jgi:zinc and cadmium transporter
MSDRRASVEVDEAQEGSGKREEVAVTTSQVLVWIVGFSMLGSLGSVGAAALLLVVPAAGRRALLPGLLSYAAGTLWGAALLGLLPHALERGTMLPTLGTVLAGLVLFFGLEKLVLWRHCHDPACDMHKAAGPLILLGDALHNFVGGVVIAAAFLVAVPLGITTAIAVIAHELPQEVGDFAILLESGYTRSQALMLNGLSSLATLPGAFLGWLALDVIQGAISTILALSAASFLYIATADLIPQLHQRLGLGSSLNQGLGLLAGIGTILLVRLFH